MAINKYYSIVCDVCHKEIASFDDSPDEEITVYSYDMNEVFCEECAPEHATSKMVKEME